MSKLSQYDKNNTYLENYNYALKQKEQRYNAEKEEIERDKLELDKIRNQIEMEKQLEKQKKDFLKKQQFEEYSNYLKQRQSILEMRNNPNIKLSGEERTIQKPNYNKQMDNLCLNPTKQTNLQPKEQFINFSQAGRNYQRGYSHGYNILTGEIFSNSKANNNIKIPTQPSTNNKIQDNIEQNMEYEKEYKNMIEPKNEGIIIKEENNFIPNNKDNNSNEEEYMKYMEILRQKEIEQNNNINNNNHIYNEKNNDYPEYQEQYMYNDNNININKEKDNLEHYEELNNPKPSYHKIPSIPKEPEIKNELSQMNRPTTQNIEKRYPHHILDSSKNEYLLNKQKNMISNYDIFKGKDYFQTHYQNQNKENDVNNPKYGKLEKQREYAKFLEGQINSKRIYEETIRNLSKNSEPEIERLKNNNMMIFGGMNPYQKIKERNSKLNDIPKDPYSNKEYNINADSFLSSNPITNPMNSYQYNSGRRRASGRLQNNGNIIMGK